MQKTRWKQIDWEQVETYINRLQIRIVKAVQENKWRLVRREDYNT
jgi:RNA-directed DNA polymerase